jgi:uncharacterized protein
MVHGRPIVDADSHKCENPLVFVDFIPSRYRKRISFVRDRYGEQRFRIVDRNPATGAADLPRVFLQPEGHGKGTYRPYHEETTIGGLFNRVRVEHMDREGIDHQVIYGSITLAFCSLVDAELAVALCRAYNDYIAEDCAGYAQRLHPVAVLPLQDPGEAVREMRRCVEVLGMPGVSIAPNVPQPHPAAPDRFPDVRLPKPLSHPDFFPIYEEAQRLGIAIGVHGAPGVGLAAGTADQLDSFTLVHVFANRSLQQMAIAKLVFDGVMEAFPKLRFGFLEAGAGWVPDFFHCLHEHWEKRVRDFDPSIEPSVARFLLEFARERRGGDAALARKARQLLGGLFGESESGASAEELRAFRYEHPKLTRDPWEYLARGQVFLTVEPDDRAPEYLPAALGDLGTRLCGMAVDYGHWDATLEGCVAHIAERPGIGADHATRLLSENALEFYGERLRRRIGLGEPASAGSGDRPGSPSRTASIVAPRRFDPFRPLGPEERRRHLAAYERHLEERNGEIDLAARRLSRRERYFEDLAQQPLRWRGALDRDGFFERFLGSGKSPIDARTLWLVAIAKANEGESYGVDQELKRLLARGTGGMDTALLHIFLEEQYHSRILIEACRTCNLEVEFQPPPWHSRLFIHAIYHFPNRVRWVLILAGEVLGTTIFKLLLDHTGLFSSEPEVEARLRSLISEIWRDEALHVAFLRAKLGPLALRGARALLPLVVKNVMWELPQLSELGCDDRELAARLRGGLEIPPGLEWLEPDPIA